ncbi:MAG TPA: hypothetical protein VK897_13320 [Anaerolineales bacterium]|nr:hypothetical protein [Anaerolineales bacterium]
MIQQLQGTHKHEIQGVGDCIHQHYVHIVGIVSFMASKKSRTRSFLQTAVLGLAFKAHLQLYIRRLESIISPPRAD